MPYTAFKRGDSALVEVLQYATDIIVGVTAVGELLAAFAAGSRQRENRGELTRFLNSPPVKVVPGGVTTGDFYGVVYATLRKQGQPIPTNDL